MSTDTIDDAALIAGFRNILSTNYLGTASMAMLIYDHLLTFSDEVEYVWKRRKGFVGTLFLINRYLTPLGFVVGMVAYLSPFFVNDVCSNFVKYEGAFTTVSLAIAALMMIIRIHALYGGARRVTGLVGMLLTAQLCVQAWLLSGGRAVPHPDGVVNCTLIFAEDVGAWGSLYAWMPLIFDTCVLVLTIYKTLVVFHTGAAGGVVMTFVRDGIMYYSVIFTANLVLAVMLVSADNGIKAIAAQFEQLITVTMMGRITLSLKKKSLDDGNSSDDVTSPISYRTRSISFGTSTTATNWRRWSHKTGTRSPPPTQRETFEMSVIVDKEVTVD